MVLRSHFRALVLAGAVILLGSCEFPGCGAQPQSSTGTWTPAPTGASHCQGPNNLLFDGYYPDLAFSGGATAPSFDTRRLAGGPKSYCLTHVATYHWNNGQGAPSPGQLSLVDDKGKAIGSWKASATPASGGVLANWEADVPVTPPVILNGTYTVKDSGTETWSWSQMSNHAGFVRVWGTTYAP